MNVSIDIDDDAWAKVPGLEAVARRAVESAVGGAGRDAGHSETTILFTSDEAIATINGEWRGKAGPTNVLSFPAPQGLPVPAGEDRPLGDIVLASGVIAREAAEQGKSLPDHVAHLIVHGVLHLLGYDHEDDAEADEMERLEADILKGMGISDPYE